MIKYLIALPDGSEISSGHGTTNAIMNVSHTEITNDQTDLSLGSVCSSVVEISLITPGAGLNISAGFEITLYRVDGASKTKVGLFTAEKPTRVKANRYKITAYDRVSWLDKDLTDWLSNLSGWPYSLGTFAKMVCDACGVPLATTSFPNSGFYTNRPSLSGGITGRQLMKWIAEIAGRFCVANADGELEFRWYQQSDVVIAPSGDNFFYSGSLSYEDYQVSQIDAVKVRLADSDSGALWPEGDAENPYIIKGNRLLNSNITESTRAVLENIRQALGAVQYTPCKVTIPATADVHAGQIVEVVDSNGNRFSTYVMKAVYSGQKIKIESTGNAKRNSSEAMNFLSNQDLKDYANSAAAGAVQSQTQEDVFNKLTNGGAESGIYLKDGILYINANFIQSGFLSADIIRAGQIRSTDFEVEELQELYPAADDVHEASGKIITLSTASNRPLKALTLYGKTTQNGTPTPDSPVELESVGDGGSITVRIGTSEVDENPQTLTVSTPNGLPGIPVSSGGNYTDENGQQWVCDEIDFARGKYIKRIRDIVIGDTFATNTYTSISVRGNTVRCWVYIAKDKGLNAMVAKDALLCDKLPYNETYNSDKLGILGGIEMGYANSFVLWLPKEAGTTAAEIKAYLDANPLRLLIADQVATETYLTAEEIAQYSALHTNYPNTTIYNDDMAGMAVRYVDHSGGFIYPSNSLYPNNGEQIIRGFEIDFESGVIRGVFWSDAIAALEDRVLTLETQRSYTEKAVSDLQTANAELQTQVSELENDVVVQQRVISTLEAQITALQIAGQERDSRLTKLETSLVYPKSAT